MVRDGHKLDPPVNHASINPVARLALAMEYEAVGFIISPFWTL